MTPTMLDKRLSALEASRAASPVLHTQEEREAAVRTYAELLESPSLPDPRQAAYYADRSLKEIASDYDAMLRGAPAPWERRP